MLNIIGKASYSIARNWVRVASHLLFFGGLCAVIYGAFVFYRPVGFGVAGAVAVWIARLMEQEQRESR